eukprot:ANDGO_01750.mRNA.1 hypothetical protein
MQDSVSGDRVLLTNWLNHCFIEYPQSAVLPNLQTLQSLLRQHESDSEANSVRLLLENAFEEPVVDAISFISRIENEMQSECRSKEQMETPHKTHSGRNEAEADPSELIPDGFRLVSEADLNAAVRIVEQLENEKDRLTLEIENAHEKIEACATMPVKIARLQQDIQDEKDRNGALLKKYERAVQDSDQLQKRLSDNLSELVSLRLELEAKCSQCEEIEHERDRLRKRLDAALERNRELTLDLQAAQANGKYATQFDFSDAADNHLEKMREKQHTALVEKLELRIVRHKQETAEQLAISEELRQRVHQLETEVEHVRLENIRSQQIIHYGNRQAEAMEAEKTEAWERCQEAESSKAAEVHKRRTAEHAVEKTERRTRKIIWSTLAGTVLYQWGLFLYAMWASSSQR